MNPTQKNILCRLTTLLLIPLLSLLLPLYHPNHPLSAHLLHRAITLSPYTTLHKHPQHLPSPPYTLFSTRVILPSLTPTPAYIHISSNGTISSISSTLLSHPSPLHTILVDVSPSVIMPGLIDPHVHVNEPGRTHWEGFHTATRAAAAGGTTTILDMPLNTIPATVSMQALREKMNVITNSSLATDVGIIAGIVPHNLHQIEPLMKAGVIAFKSFLVDSQSQDFPHVDAQTFAEAVQVLDRIAIEEGEKTVPYIVHAEVDDEGTETGVRASGNHQFDHTSYKQYESTRPVEWEIKAVENVLQSVNGSNVHVHVAHVSSQQVVRLLDEKKDLLVKARISAETCPHYLFFEMETLPNGQAQWKCAPPIRTRENRQKLLQKVCQSSKSTILNMVASDHSPCPDELKETNGNLTNAWGGIAGLQYRLQVTWSACMNYGQSIGQLAYLMATMPAKLFGLSSRKGELKQGLDADLVIWNPEVEDVLKKENCYHRWKLSAYHDSKVFGQIRYSVVRGREVFSGVEQVKEEDRFNSYGKLIVRQKDSIDIIGTT